MATIALEKLEDQLNCSICLDTYTNPKQLHCHHVYCQQCLIKLVVRDQQGQLTLTCPNCRQVTPVPASGVKGLQAAFHINKLLEIMEEHKAVSSIKAGTTETAENTSLISTKQSITVVCTEHSGKAVDLYCETCGKTICWKCVIKGGRHQNHEYEELVEAFERYKREIMSSLEPVEKQLTIVEEALAQLDARQDEISNQRASTEADIHSTITQLQDTLEMRKSELVSHLDQITEVKFKSLAVQRDQMETTRAQLSSCLHFMRENLKTVNQGEALKMRSNSVTNQGTDYHVPARSVTS